MLLMNIKRLLVAVIATSLAALTLVTQSANATEPLTEAQAITKVQYLVDSLNNEIVSYSSQSDSWTSDFPVMKTKLDALSVQLNALGARFMELSTPFQVVNSTLSNCIFSERTTSYSLTCDKSTDYSVSFGVGEEPIQNELFVKINYSINLNGDILNWVILNGFTDDSFPMDEIYFVNASLDDPVTYPKSTRMLPPMDYSGLSDAERSERLLAHILKCPKRPELKFLNICIAAAEAMEKFNAAIPDMTEFGKAMAVLKVRLDELKAKPEAEE